VSDRPGPVLVTGANSGIGLASTLRFAERGWEAHGTVRSQAKADVLLAAAEERGVIERVHPIVLDVSDHDAVTAAWPDLPDYYGVVNNAGYSEVGAVEEVGAAKAKAQLDVNLVAPAVVSGLALPGMRRLGGGRIVMISSVAGKQAIMPLNAWYHASKFGLEALSDVLRMEVAGFGVKVAIVEPGFFKTEITARAEELNEVRRAAPDSPYADAYERTAQILGTFGRFLPPAWIVARTVVAAVESKRPRRRYPVGLDALTVSTAGGIVPRVLTDSVARLISNLPSDAEGAEGADDEDGAA
jgi:NAD(P)-dependent dehydrogenase (short-subunit alcohol dehydrogenase family)